jgi:hypothetical protein
MYRSMVVTGVLVHGMVVFAASPFDRLRDW